MRLIVCLNDINVLVVGYFGFATEQLDGQTVKTRNFYNLIKSKEKEINADVRFFDTQQLQYEKKSYFSLLSKLLASKRVYLIGARRSLAYLLPLVFLISIVMKKKMYVVAVGGWLDEYLRSKPLHRFILRRVAAIYPQNQDLCYQLKKMYGFSNVHHLNNFRFVKSSSGRTMRDDLTLKFVFMARVQAEKGVEVLFKISDMCTKLGVERYKIDIYGPIKPSYASTLEALLSSHDSTVIQYKGILDPEDINNVLSNYDLLLFPTKYYTEGFPGTILDAYNSGVPVLASNWKYASEFITDGESGCIAPFNDDEAFIDKFYYLISNRKLLNELRHGAAIAAKRYSPEAAWDVIKSTF